MGAHAVSAVPPDRFGSRTQNVALSLNASAIYLGQAASAAICALVLLYGSLAALWVAGLCIVTGFLVLLLSTSSPATEPTSETEGSR